MYSSSALYLYEAFYLEIDNVFPDDISSFEIYSCANYPELHEIAMRGVIVASNFLRDRVS